MSEIKYLPVEVFDNGFVVAPDGCTTVRLKLYDLQGERYFDRFVKSEELKTADDLKAEGTEEYWEKMQYVRCEMDYDERMEIFGKGFFESVSALHPTEFLARLEAYENQPPKVGEVWEDKDGNSIVIFKIHTDFAMKTIVLYWWSRDITRGSQYLSCFGSEYLNCFLNKFHNTGKTCESLISFLEELEGLKDDG